jgi:hypothetical protein
MGKASSLLLGQRKLTTLVAQTATHRVGVCFLVGLHDQLLWYAGMVATDCVHTCSVSCGRLLELVPRVVKGDDGWPRTTNEQHDKHHNKTLHWYRPDAIRKKRQSY